MTAFLVIPYSGRDGQLLSGSFFCLSDKKSLFGRRGHTPAETGLKERFHGEEGSKDGPEGASTARSVLRAGRGSPDPPGGGENRVKDTGEEQTSFAARAQPFAYIITGSVS
jgi:hypothetical protein